MRYHSELALVDARVAVDGNIISAAGVTAGLDATLALVSLLRGDEAAQEIQLAIEYASDPVFQSGSPDTAPAEVLESFRRKYEPIGVARETEALRYAESGCRLSQRTTDTRPLEDTRRDVSIETNVRLPHDGEFCSSFFTSCSG